MSVLLAAAPAAAYHADLGAREQRAARVQRARQGLARVLHRAAGKAARLKPAAAASGSGGGGSAAAGGVMAAGRSARCDAHYDRFPASRLTMEGGRRPAPSRSCCSAAASSGHSGHRPSPVITRPRAAAASPAMDKSPAAALLAFRPRWAA